jgi:hypothetical protein
MNPPDGGQWGKKRGREKKFYGITLISNNI